MSRAPRVARRLDNVALSLIRQVFEKAPAGAINLGLGEPAFDTAPEIVAAARSILGQGRLGYTFNGGIPALRERIAERAPGERDASSVCVTVGANGGLLGSMMATADAGDEVLVPDPGFPTYEALAHLAGATPVRYPMSAESGFRFATADLAELVGERTRVIVVNSPSNPTGHVIPRGELEALAALADANDLVVIADEVYGEFWYQQRCPSLLEVTDRALVVNSLSKVEAMTGWRIGWVIGPPELIAAITAVNQHAVTCAPTLSQRAALVALTEEADGRAAATRADFGKRRRVMLAAIEARLGLPCIEPEGAFFVLVEAAPEGNSLEVALDILEQTGVITVPGVAFGRQAARFLRLSFAAGEEDIVEGIDRLAAYF